MSFKWLVRYTNTSGETNYGDLKNEPGNGSLEGAEVEVLSGDLDAGWSKTGKTEKIQKVFIQLMFD